MRTKLFDSTAKSYLRKYPRQQRFVNYDKAENILILFESNKKSNSLINNIIKTIKDDKKNVVAWGFSGAQTIIKNDLPEIKLFNKRDINIFQKPNKKIINEIKSTKFDLMIDLSPETSIPLMYLSLFANATMKTSSKTTNLQLFDFILDVKYQNKTDSGSKNAINEQFIFNEIIFYLKSIQTTD